MVIALNPHEIRQYYKDRMPELPQSDREWRGPCPIHGGKRDSLAVNAETGRACCHSTCGQGWDIPGFEQALSGYDFPTAVRRISEIVGRDLSINGTQSQRRIVCEYDYCAADGKRLFQVVRFDPKDFRQRQPDGHQGGWTWNVKGVRLVPFHLPQILVASVIWITEGEKDALAIEKLGLTATTKAGGAGKWRHEYREHFQGKQVNIIPDADAPGRKHAEDVAQSLQSVAASVRIVALPRGKDVSEWIAAGGTAEQLRELAAAASEYEPEPPVPNEADLGNDDVTEIPRVLDRSDPLACARRFLTDEFTRDNRASLYHHHGEFFAWVRSHYRSVDETDLRARLYAYLETAKVKDGDTLRPFRPTTRRIAETLDTLRAAAHLPSEITPPTWLEQVCDLSPSEWLAFLESVWGDDTEAVATLQEAFGYWLTSETRQQKIFLLVGPKRAGKGTIARVLTALLGKANVAGPTLGALSANFGLAPLIGKPLAIISDARLSGRSDQAVIVERLLSISGEDVLTIDRKHRQPWTGTLPTRFLLLTNELPRLADASGAMASRFVVLTMRASFYGKEDTGLFDRLRGELPGILCWAVKGLQRLRERGRFVQPRSSAEAIRELEDLGSPVGAFVRDCCSVGPGLSATTDEIYAAWQAWCRDQGREHAGTKARFSRDLRAVLPSVTIRQRREAFHVIRVYEGVGTL